MEHSVKIGDKVVFNSAQIEEFKAETDIDNKDIQQFRKLILAGVDQVGTVVELMGNLTKVSYPDGWDLPVPTKYLIVLPQTQ